MISDIYNIQSQQTNYTFVKYPYIKHNYTHMEVLLI